MRKSKLPLTLQACQIKLYEAAAALSWALPAIFIVLVAVSCHNASKRAQAWVVNGKQQRGDIRTLEGKQEPAQGKN